MFFSHRAVWRAGDRVPRRLERRLGGKGMNLFRLSARGLSVPPFAVISTSVFNAALRPQRASLEALLAGIDWERRDSIESASARARDLVLGARIPRSMARCIEALPDRDAGPGGAFAVRSSVVGEDSCEHSYAGQMESFLNVERGRIQEAVRNVWASAFSPRALLYRAGRGLPLEGITTAVIVQQMVPSETSGVAFSRDPQSRAAVCVICAGYGLGEGVVQDLVETDCYRVEWGRSTVGRSISAKTRRTECKPGGGTRTAPLCGRLRSQSVLTDRQVLEVARLVQHLEETLGCPQDIEWAYADGRLFILQARPIIFPPTSLADEGRIWDNSNIVESYPGLTLPLTFSFVREGYALCFRRAVLGFLLCRREIEGDLHIFDEMIGLLDGRVYYNLLNWYRMMSYLPGYRQYRNSWDRMIGITRALPFPGRRLSLPNRLYALAVVLYRLLAVRRTARRFFRHFQPACRRYQGIDFEKLPAGELLSVYRAMQREFSLRWHLTLYNDFCAIRYFDWLRGLCGRWGLQRFPNLHNDLLCGEGDVESMHAVRSLLSVCALVRREPRFVELFTETSARKIWSRIHAESGFGPLGAALDQHLADFGDRGLEELKLEQPTFRDRPEIVIALLKSYLERGTSADQLTRSEARLRSEAEANARSVLRNPLKRALFTWVLRQARLSVAQRENMRFARSRLFGISRRLFRRLADLFAEQGLLCCREDFYYLTVGEAFGYLQGTAVTQDLQRLVDMRREEYAQFEAHRLPDRLQTAGVPYPVPQAPEATAGLGDGSLWGTGCSGGSVRGTAWIVSDPRAADRAGDYVLIAKSTDPGWAFLMIRARGIVVERGSVLSHTAIIGRELGIPTVVGVPAATDRIQDGRPVSINGRTGEVRCG